MLTTIRSWWRRPRKSRDRGPTPPGAANAAAPTTSDSSAAHLVAEQMADPLLIVDAMLTQERYCLLLRPQVAVSLPEEQYHRANSALERSMARIPGGAVELDPGGTHASQEPRRIESYLLDRYPVTNRQFRQFLEAGGYTLSALWQTEAAAFMPEFVDQTGTAGPRFWRGGHYPTGEDDHPVVGVSWFEAAAFARWAGKRLPGECEWLKAAAWPVPGGDGRLSQRRYPWGDCMDLGRCNVWGSGRGKTASVRQFAAGVSVGGVYQLIGNVWEWTSGDFDLVDDDNKPLELPAPMKAIRGGAFDTYFEQQACCSFRSGEKPAARKHNIGFRCALGVCDVAGPRRTCSAAPGAAHD